MAPLSERRPVYERSGEGSAGTVKAWRMLVQSPTKVFAHNNRSLFLRNSVGNVPVAYASYRNTLIISYFV